MKKLKNLWYAFAGVAIACFVLLGLWWCASTDVFDKVTVTPVSETNLTIVTRERNFSGQNDPVVVSYYYLMNKGDTLASGCYDFNPYINARGVVYIPQNGVFDCRGGQVAKLIEVKPNTSLQIVAVEGKDKLLIVAGSPFWSLKEMGWDDSQVKRYEYDLKTRKLSEL